MNWELILAALALLAAGLAALYARWSVAEAKKANNIGRLNALLALRIHYLSLLEHQAKMANTLKDSPSGLQAVQSACADLDAKLRNVSAEIDKEHTNIVGSYA